MVPSDSASKPQLVPLGPGRQAVINGALVTASAPCTLEVGPGAYVLAGQALARDKNALSNPREELYFSMLEAGTDPKRFNEARFRLFRLLSQVVAQDRTYQAQRECALCASALLKGNVEEATQCAARMASARLEEPAKRGAAGDRRNPSFVRRVASEP